MTDFIMYATAIKVVNSGGFFSTAKVFLVTFAFTYFTLSYTKMPAYKRGKKSRPGSAVDTPTAQSDIRDTDQQPLANFRDTGINNLHVVAKPFKNPNYKSHQSRWKNLKQVVAQEQTQDWPVEFPTYWNIEAAPSLKPQKKYCDVTGLPAKYTDPKTNVRYYSAEVYQILKNMPPGSEQQYLELRNANVMLK